MAIVIEEIRTSGRRKYLYSAYIWRLFWYLALMNGSVSTIKRTAIQSNYISLLLAAEFYLISRIFIIEKDFLKSLFQQKHTCSIWNPSTVGFSLVELIFQRSNTWAGSLVWIEGVSFIAVTEVGCPVTHTELLAAVGPQGTHIHIYKGHWQRATSVIPEERNSH